jgi:phosphocarrier protein HPr
MTVSAECTIRNTYGFHVRPTTAFMEVAGRFESRIEVRAAGGEPVDGRSAMGLISLGAVQGDTVQIACEGPDEEETLAALVELIDSRFGGIE